MSLSPGGRIGPYQVVEPIGAGGMGQVYRARDTRLGRDVALKVLPEAVAADPERRARLEREARVLASLNHPNIATLYGIEESPEGCALVMELVDGVTLADRLALRACETFGLPVEQALTIARQIAEALEVAHAQGIVHRDLKPANVTVRNDGTVKVLDFGLAKAFTATSDSGVTVTAMSADTHAVAGTPAYMSPEQARGEGIGPQSDIWSFGVVLYELLTGASPFARPTTAETLASVLESRPNYALLPPGLPVMARHVIRRCLENDPKRRWQHIGDVRIGIDAVLSTTTEKADSPIAVRARSRALGPWMAMTVIAVVATAGLIALLNGGRTSDAPLFEGRIDLPGSASNSFAPDFAIAPDAQNIVIVAADPSGRQMLWIRRRDSLAMRQLEGTEGAEAPFWSHDSQSVAFVANGRLRRIRVAGGPPSPVADAAYPVPGTWSRDNVILFTPGPDAPLARVSASGGIPSPVTVLNATAGEATHAYPFFLPDGRRFLYAAWSATGAALGVHAGSLDSANSTLLLSGIPSAQYADGALFYVQETALVVRGFDSVRATFTTNETVPIAAQVSLGRLSLTNAGARAPAFSVSSAGMLVYQRAPASLSRLVWLDSRGREIEVLGQAAEYSDVFLSPDDQYAASSIATGDGTRDIWRFDTKGRTSRPIASGPGNQGGGVFSPDGRNRVAFSSDREGRVDLYETSVSGSGRETLLLKDDAVKHVLDWSADFLLYLTVSGPNLAVDLWTLPLSGDDRRPRPFLKTPAQEGIGAQASPDGKWVAYQSNKSGHFEVYVSPYPADPERERQVSTSGGSTARWGPGGRELYYYEPAGGQLLVVPLTYGGNDVRVGDSSVLFKVRRPEALGAWYDVTGDGQRFLVNVPLEGESGSHLRFIQNWRAKAERAK